jgi:phospholipase/lecithinase/hemolysin
MKTKYTAWAAVGASLLVAACGGGGGAGDQGTKFKPTALVTFGDSLSDIGTFNVGTVAATGGGKWTINSATAKNWTELIAAQYSLPAPCPAQLGGVSPAPGLLTLYGITVTGGAATAKAGCLNYAQGSARVSDTNPGSGAGYWAYGPNSIGEQTFFTNVIGSVLGATAGAGAAAQQAPLGLSADSVQTQISRYLGTNTSFNGGQLVTVMAGGNDAIMNFAAVASATGTSAVATAVLAGWLPASALAGSTAGLSAAQISLLQALGANSSAPAAAFAAAAGAGVTNMATAGTALATLIKNQIVANGATHVVVVNVPDLSVAPAVTSVNNPNVTAAVKQMITTFNAALASSLAGVSGVQIVDSASVLDDEVANPGQYSLTNVTAPACDTSSASNPTNAFPAATSHGSSLMCTAASTLTGVDTSHYLFADTVHPTPYGYLLLARLVSKTLVTAGWL